jgi:hypothetical protein
MEKTIFTSEGILEQLDTCVHDFTFPMLDNGYVYLANTQLKAYRDNNRWIIIIEVVGFNYRGGGHYGINNCLHIFGNCLKYPAGTRNENFLSLTTDDEEGDTFDENEEFYLQPNTDLFVLRGQKHSICHDRDAYTSIGIELEDEKDITAFEFLRFLTHTTPDSFWATEEELKERVRRDIPQIIELKEWFHPDVVNEEIPSKNETFKQLAKVLETGDIGFYKPTKKANTHWSNWPEGGSL